MFGKRIRRQSTYVLKSPATVKDMQDGLQATTIDHDIDDAGRVACDVSAQLAEYDFRVRGFLEFGNRFERA